MCENLASKISAKMDPLVGQEWDTPFPPFPCYILQIIFTSTSYSPNTVHYVWSVCYLRWCVPRQALQLAITHDTTCILSFRVHVKLYYRIVSYRNIYIRCISQHIISWIHFDDIWKYIHTHSML